VHSPGKDRRYLSAVQGYVFIAYCESNSAPFVQSVYPALAYQGCAPEAPGCHGQLTFAFGRLEKLTFSDNLCLLIIH